LQWTEEHSVFIPEIDDEHRVLFQLCQDLRHAVLAGEAEDRLEFLAGRLANRAAAHFQHEEREMRASRYASWSWHEHQHQTARGLVVALCDSIRGHGTDSVFEALEALTGWMLEHVTVADRMLGAHLRNHERERLAS